MRRIDQTETQQSLRDFMRHSGLTRAWVARVCDIPYKAFCEFYNDKRSIPRDKERQLVDFMKQYSKVNAHWMFYKSCTD